MNNTLGKNITIRLSGDDLERFDSLCLKYGLSRSDLIRKSVYSYTDKAPGMIEAARDVAVSNSLSNEVSELASHSLTKKVLKQGIKVYDSEGNLVSVINNLRSLLDFIESKVFYE